MRPALRAFVVASLLLPASALRAGDSTVVVKNGSLRITASTGDDALTIDQAGIADPHVFRVAPSGGSTVNGSAISQTFAGVKKDVLLDPGGGSDSIVVSIARIPRDLKIASAAIGALGVNLNTVTIGRDLTSDLPRTPIVLHPVFSRIGRDVQVRGSDQFDSLSFGVELVIGRDVRFDGRGDTDVLTLIHAAVGGRVTIADSPGSDAVFVSSCTIDGALRVDDQTQETTATLDFSTIGSLSIETGSLTDAVNLSRVVVRGKSLISLGGGGDAAQFSETSFGGPVRILTGAGGDFATLQDNCVLSGGAQIDLGSGDNQLTFMKSSSAKSLVIAGGSGKDTLTVQEAHVGGSLRLRAGDSPRGMDQAPLSLTSLRVDGSLELVAGNGTNVVSAVDSTIGDDVRMRFGAGDNEVHLLAVRGRNCRIDGGSGAETFELSGGCGWRGDTRIEAGAGDNELTIGDGTYRGDVTVRAGAGDDMLTVNAAAVIVGKRKIDLGAGTNTGP